MGSRVLALALLISAVHAGDELTEAARRDRVGRLRVRAGAWYTCRKYLFSDGCYVNRAHYRKAYFEMMTPQYRSEPGRADAFDAIESLTAPQDLDPRNTLPARELLRDDPMQAKLDEKVFKDTFEEFLSRIRQPEALVSWAIDRVELADAAHGVVWTKLNGEKEPTPMRWIRTDDANGKPEWFVYDKETDGDWPGEAPEEIDWDTWDVRANEACAKASTSLAKVDALKALAAKVVVIETVKIVDVAPDGEGAKIVVCQLWGGPGRKTVDVTKDELPLVREWGKWDRLTWRLRVIVDGAEHNDIRGQVLWDGPNSAKWSKNTGLGGYRLDRTEPASFPEWCAKFDAADAAGRKAMVRKMQGKAFVDDAKVFEIIGPNAQVVFGNGEKLSVPLDDPQAMEEVRIGDTISVARTAWLVGTEEMFTDRSLLMFRLGIIARKAGGG